MENIKELFATLDNVLAVFVIAISLFTFLFTFMKNKIIKGEYRW